MASLGEFSKRWRVRAGYPVALVCFWAARPVPKWLAIGAGIAVCGLVLRAAAAGYLRKHEQLSTSGPYAHTRNPLYLGSTLLAAAFAAASHSLIVAVILAAYFAVFYPAVMREEEQELRARYGAAFDAYAARVPLFWLRLSPAGVLHDAGTRFSWAVYRRNREYQAVLGFLAVIALLWLRMRWRG